MRYFTPELVPDDDLPMPSSLEDQFGGLPWGLAAERWPVCASCGTPQVLVAQLCHHPGRLDLGAEGRALLVYVCPDASGRCATWDMNSGANACFVVEGQEL